MYDAVATAVEGTRGAYHGTAVPTPTSVLQELPDLVNGGTVPASGGDLSFGDEYGNPGAKPLPVLRIPRDAATPVPIATCASTKPEYAYCTPK